MLNIVNLQGFIVDPPELSETSAGVKFTTFRLLVERTGDKKKMKYTADYIQIDVYGPRAVAICKHLQKNSQILVTGNIVTDHYDNYKRETIYTTRVVASNVVFLPHVQKSKWADEFFEEYPEIGKLYKKYAAEKRKQKKEDIEEMEKNL